MAVTSFLILKMQEDDRIVVYGYGNSKDDIEGTVEFDAETGEVVRKSAENRRADIVAGFMPFRRKRTGTWPGHHTYAA
ncbi:hypothetical protein AB0B28_09205 [Glycomyces sp. NPDC046736]|uniref:hypothetical protein n=1 Tax=Glycomyces sp. NPDC046736 TaxID=3155615 RepID=UPI0033CBBB67